MSEREWLEGLRPEDRDAVPARRPVDDALDRLRDQLRDALNGRFVGGDVAWRILNRWDDLTHAEAQAEQLREERDALLRREPERRMLEERASDVERQSRERTHLEGALRAARGNLEGRLAAEAEVRRLREGLREAVTGFNDISLILEAENDGYQERAYKRAMEEWRHVRPLLAVSSRPTGDTPVNEVEPEGEQT